MMPASESIDSKRFQVRRRIGSGAFGVVYEAFDPVRNQVVALKVLRNATPDALYRFKREFRSVTHLAHRNLVRLHELIVEGDQWLVSMELIRGTTFIEHVRRETPHDAGPGLPPMRADIGRLRVALAQLAAGVSALHSAGKLHRDIKPSNVLVAEDRRVVLLDFGLVTDTDTRATAESTSTSGTPAYMSPEQGGGEPLGPPSDWYSVGILLYDTLTGQVPFHGSYLDVINEKRAGDVPPPSTVVSGIPEDIDALCRDLLRRDPRKRPSGEEVLRRLAGSKPPTGTASPAPPTAVIGRDRHFKALRQAFKESARGGPVTVCVHGPSGAGKTALVHTFLERLREDTRKLVVLTGRCYPGESMPYKGVDSLVDALHRHLSRLPFHELDALMPRDIAAAEQLFPVLSDVADLVRAGRRGGTTVATDPLELRRRAFAAIRELFLRVCDRRPLVLVIDDLQWADVDGAELMMELLRPPDAPALLFIAAYRSDEAQASPFVRAFRAAMPVRDVEVAALHLDDSRQLAARLLRGSPADSRRVAKMIADASGGDPSLIAELARSFVLAGDAIAPMTDADAIIREVLEVRLRALEPGAARMLQYVAVNARPILIPALRLAYRRDDFDDIVAPLVAQNLIRTRATPAGEAVETYHPRVAAAAIALLAEDELRDMHAVLALTLEGFAGTDAALLAEHFRAAGMAERAARYAVRE